jgi:hypothetical protein
MMMPTLIMAVMAAVAAVSAAFGVEGSAHPYKIRFEALQHILDPHGQAEYEEPGFGFRWANADFPDAKQGA